MEGAVAEALKQVVGLFGAGGVLAVISWGVAVYLYREVVRLNAEIRQCSEQRLSDTKTILDRAFVALHDAAEGFRDCTKSLNSNNLAMESRTRAQEAIAHELDRLRLHIDARDKIEDMRDQARGRP